MTANGNLGHVKIQIGIEDEVSTIISALRQYVRLLNTMLAEQVKDNDWETCVLTELYTALTLLERFDNPKTYEEVVLE